MSSKDAKKLSPQELVEQVSSLWEDAKGENDFINNICYMVLSSVVKAYQEMDAAGRSWLRKDEELDVAIIKSVHKIGSMLEAVEHNAGTVNAVANNVGNVH